MKKFKSRSRFVWFWFVSILCLSVFALVIGSGVLTLVGHKPPNWVREATMWGFGLLAVILVVVETKGINMFSLEPFGRKGKYVVTDPPLEKEPHCPTCSCGKKDKVDNEGE